MAQRSNSDISSLSSGQPKMRNKKLCSQSSKHIHLGHRSSSASCPRKSEEDASNVASMDSCSATEERRSPGHRRGRSAEPRLEKPKTPSAKCISCGTPAGTFLEVPPIRSELANLKETIPEVDEGKGMNSLGAFEDSHETRKRTSISTDTRLPLRPEAVVILPEDQPKFQSLQRYLSQNSKAKSQNPCEEKQPKNEAPPAAELLNSPTRQVIILDSAIGTPSPSDQPVHRWGPQSRIVSVEREECLRKEAAALSVEREEMPRRHQAVTVSRSRTWSFPDKLMMENMARRRVIKPPKTLGIRQTSLVGSGEGEGGWLDGQKEEDILPDAEASLVQRLSYFVAEEYHPSATPEPVSKSQLQQQNASSEPAVKIQENDIREEEEEEETVKNSLPEIKTDRNNQNEETLKQRELVIHRDENGYGLTVTGDNPVFVQSIKENGAAAKAGVQKGDKIVKVNGTVVTNCNHIDVVKLIKSNSFATLTLVGRTPIPDNSSKNQIPLSSNQMPNSYKPIRTHRTHRSSYSSSASSIPHEHLSDRTISGPRAVNHDKDVEFKAQKVATIQMMLKQVQEEYEKMKQDYRQNPTEKLQLRLEVKTQMLRRVEDQLRSLTSEMAAAAAQLSPGSKNSKVEPSTNSCHDSRSSVGKGLPPNGTRKDRKREDTPGTEEDESVERIPNADVVRSSSSGQGLPAQSPDLRWSDDSMQLSSGANTPSKEYTFLPGLKLAAVPYRAHAAGSRPDDMAVSPPRTLAQANVISIEDDDFSIDDDQVNDSGIFSSLCQLKVNPAHLAVFLHYLISNSDPSPLLFYLVTESYPSGTMKELRKWAYEIFSSFLVEKAPLKFNVDDATVSQIENTLSRSYEKEELMRTVFVTARKAAENEIKDLLADFRSKRALGLGSIYGDHELKESMERTSELKVVDRSLWRHFERLAQNEESDRSQAMASALATFFKQIGLTAVKTSSLLDRIPVFVAKDKKLFKFSKTNKKTYFVKGHCFAAQHYFTSTICPHCQRIIGGIGNQGFQCSNCDMNTHPQCRDQVLETCSSGSLKKKRDKEKRPSSVFEKIISRKPSMCIPLSARESMQQYFADETVLTPSTTFSIQTEETEDAEHHPLSISKAAGRNTEHAKLEDDSRLSCPSEGSSPPTLAETDDIVYNRVRSESFNQRPELRASVRRAHSDVMVENPTKLLEPINSSGSSSNSSLSIRSGDSASNSNECLDDVTRASEAFSQKPQFNDSDLETEPDLPPLEAIIPKELLKKLKPKEKKRQEVINELFYTERAHVRNLKVMHRLLYKPMCDEPWIPSEFVVLLFPNLEEVIEIHASLSNDFKARRNESLVVGDIAHILINHFSGEEGEKMKQASAQFCQNQSHALEVLRQKQRKDQKLALFLQEAASHPLCRRLELKDLIPTVMQRLTKYPLLIENLLRYTMSNTDEYDLLLRAFECTKEILNFVNTRVKESENHQKLVNLQKHLDKRPIENSVHPGVAEFKKLDFTRHKMIYDGELTWRISRNKQIDLHVVLLEDILVLLQKQDDKLVMRCQSTNVVASKEDTKLTHSPVIKLACLLTRNVATDKRALFLVNTSDYGPQIYELVASSKDEKNRWFKYITDAAESYKSKDGAKNKKPMPQSTLESHSGGGALEEMMTLGKTSKTAENDLQRQENGDSVNNESSHRSSYSQQQQQQQQQRQVQFDRQHPVGRVEELRFEASQLVQPNEVKVSLTPTIDKLESTMNPINLIKEKNRMIETALNEKKNLVANILQIPIKDYDHISDVVEEMRNGGDAKELLLSSLTQADALTQLINEGLDAHLITNEGEPSCSSEADSDPLRTPTPTTKTIAPTGNPDAGRQTSEAVAREIKISVSCSQLMGISGRLHDNLTQLMELISNREKERDRLEAELSHCNYQLNQLTSLGVSRYSSAEASIVPFASCLSEAIEPLIDTRDDCLASLSVVYPVVTEYFEVTEPESVVTLNASPTVKLDSVPMATDSSRSKTRLEEDTTLGSESS